MSGDQSLMQIIKDAVDQRGSFYPFTNAYRLLNGFYEGIPGLVLDRYGSALVILDHAEPGEFSVLVDEISQWALQHLTGLDAVLHKVRQSADDQLRCGILRTGNTLPDVVSEFDVQYALNLQMHQDASFYLDTRYLRKWLKENMSGKRVLNAFAYTGSLGVAAGAGGASQVVQTDLKEKYLHIAQQSWTLNNLPAGRVQYLPGDFFRVIGRMRTAGNLFDCIILDPPFFSSTDAGTVDLLGEMTRLINKVRPLVAHDGWLVLINNALFLPGADFMAELDALCQSEYLAFETMIPIPTDITGYPETINSKPPVDPAPFNHPTKIAILKVYRKDGRQ